MMEEPDWGNIRGMRAIVNSRYNRHWMMQGVCVGYIIDEREDKQVVVRVGDTPRLIYAHWSNFKFFQEESK